MFYGSERGELFAVLPALECDGMKTLLGTADIHTDAEGTGLVLIHTDSRGRNDSRYIVCFLGRIKKRYPTPLFSLLAELFAP